MKKFDAVIFDLDGTIIDVPYNWNLIKQELETGGVPILTYLSQLDEPEKTRKSNILERHESMATAQARLKEGIPQLLNFLEKKSVKKALVTNNSRNNVDVLLKKFELIFDIVITRESGLWKPSGAPFRAVLDMLGVEKEACCVVGDSHFDVYAAIDAGISSIFIVNGKIKSISEKDVTFVHSIEELRKKIECILDNS